MTPTRKTVIVAPGNDNERSGAHNNGHNGDGAAHDYGHNGRSTPGATISTGSDTSN